MLVNQFRTSAFKRPMLCSLVSALGRNVSTDTGESKVYELRKYSLKPAGAPTFMKLFEEYHPLRFKYSENFGYWNVDMGGLNEVVHIWEYDSFAHRAAVRAALAKDDEWMEGFIQKAFPHIAKQDNSVILRAAWCDLQKDKTGSGVFELASYGMKIGGPKVWEDKLKNSVLAHARLDYADLIGVWYTDVGDHNSVQVLFRYQSFDARREGRNKAHLDRVVVNKVRDNLQNVQSHSSVLMSPVPFLAK